MTHHRAAAMSPVPLSAPVAFALALALTAGCARSKGAAAPGTTPVPPAPAVSWPAPNCPGLTGGPPVQVPGTSSQVPGTSSQVPGTSSQVPGTSSQVPGTLIRRSYRPPLFGRGEDASGELDCGRPGNPERGFFAFRDLLGRLELGGLRDSGVSIIYGRVLLADYRERPLDGRLLNRLRAAFGAVRQAGLKVLPRFYYAADQNAPDARNGRALEHIAALAPVLRDNADVIAALHAGFLGAWGEWHPEERASAADRRRILEALLAALPPTRMVLVRRPLWKQLAFGGPVTPALAFSGAPLARVGHLNDCFLATADDRGTFRAPDEEDYAAADSAYVAVGGETCAPNPPRSECPSALHALARHHWSFLNRDYHQDVLASWRQGGCLPTIACRLGYRLVLRAFTLPATARAGQPLALALGLTNDGYARPVNPRPLLLALARLTGGQRQPTSPPVLLPTGSDARAFAAGADADACLTVTLPADLPAGDYRIGLALPDPEPTLAADPRYAVRLGGGVSFEAASAINWLDATLIVTPRSLP
jgi:hypothetical protein